MLNAGLTSGVTAHTPTSNAPSLTDEYFDDLLKSSGIIPPDWNQASHNGSDQTGLTYIEDFAEPDASVGRLAFDSSFLPAGFTSGTVEGSGPYFAVELKSKVEYVAAIIHAEVETGARGHIVARLSSVRGVRFYETSQPDMRPEDKGFIERRNAYLRLVAKHFPPNPELVAVNSELDSHKIKACGRCLSVLVSR